VATSLLWSWPTVYREGILRELPDHINLNYYFLIPTHTLPHQDFFFAPLLAKSSYPAPYKGNTYVARAAQEKMESWITLAVYFSYIQ